MKEKKYHLQEDHGAAFAEEPTPAYHEKLENHLSV